MIEENTIPTQPVVPVIGTDRDSSVRGYGIIIYGIEEANSSFIINNMGQLFVSRSLDREVT